MGSGSFAISARTLISLSLIHISDGAHCNHNILRIRRAIIVEGLIICAKAAVDLVHVAVSYTHLDVYKRQAQGNPRIQQLRHRLHKGEAFFDLPPGFCHMAGKPLHRLFLKITH